MHPSSLFSLSDHLARLSKDGDPLEVVGRDGRFRAVPRSSGGRSGLQRWRIGRAPAVWSGVDVHGAGGSDAA